MAEVSLSERSAEHPSVAEMIALHADYCRQHTPEGCGHAVTGGDPGLAAIAYLMAEDEDLVLGCIGLKAIDADHAEIKTMHVRQKARGRGIGRALVDGVIALAVRQGYSQLSLETGSSDGFAASRRLYQRCGFAPCPAFGAYRDDPFSFCMTRVI